MRKYIAILALFSLILTSAACGRVVEEPKTNIDENEQQTSNNQNNSSGSHLFSLPFSTLDDFKEHINDEENRDEYYQVDGDAYIDFDSIISDSEIFELGILGKNWYWVFYINEKQSGTDNFIMSVRKCDKDFVSELSAEISCSSMDELREIELATFDWVTLKLDNYTVLYAGTATGMEMLSVYIDGYLVRFSWLPNYSIDDYTPEQSEFLSAVVPEYGATDDSVIAMLDRIKALIPTSEDSYDYELDNTHGDASGDVSSNDGSSTTDQTSGETNEDIDGDDYLYEDNNIPTIPGISPDWKPNANGKYPLKDGYTEYEMTLILACEIELDFGDMTDEEISKLEFRLIEEDTEE